MTPIRVRLKAPVLTAVRWFKHGDDDRVRLLSGWRNALMPERGWVSNERGGCVVSPGDWLLTDAGGNVEVCRPYDFADNYEVIE